MNTEGLDHPWRGGVCAVAATRGRSCQRPCSASSRRSRPSGRATSDPRARVVRRHRLRDLGLTRVNIADAVRFGRDLDNDGPRQPGARDRTA
jgi:hypothetical protein